MNWFRRFMYGRNGVDGLACATLVVSLFVSLFSRLLPDLLAFFGMIVDYTLLFFFFFRVFSRNLYKRQAENQRFLLFWNRILQWFRVHKQMIANRKTHKYMKCPQCKKRIRAPRGKGLIRIRCQGCGAQFETRT